jgi:poly-gamma-glutamate synthesis protein (capsule biosynthesis protein)
MVMFVRRGCLLLLGIALIMLAHWSSRLPAPITPPVAAQSAPPAPSMTCTFVGDILLASRVGTLAAAHGMDHLLAGVSPVLRADDLTVGNLECVVATCGTPAEKQYTFRAQPSLLPGLRRNGIDAVSLANNHTLDYGREALLQTIQHVDAAGLHSAGAGRNLAAAARPAVIDVPGARVALLAASRVYPSPDWAAGAKTPGMLSGYAPARLLEAIRQARGEADLVFVYLHWGVERAVMAHATQKQLARLCIDAGADVVVGTHPHVLQGFEYYRGKLIAYSLGNFVFTDARKTTMMLHTTFHHGQLTRATAVPCRIVGCRPQLIHSAAERQSVFTALRERSFGVHISPDGVITPRR